MPRSRRASGGHSEKQHLEAVLQGLLHETALVGMAPDQLVHSARSRETCVPRHGSSTWGPQMDASADQSVEIHMELPRLHG